MGSGGGVHSLFAAEATRVVLPAAHVVSFIAASHLHPGRELSIYDIRLCDMYHAWWQMRLLASARHVFVAKERN